MPKKTQEQQRPLLGPFEVDPDLLNVRALVDGETSIIIESLHRDSAHVIVETVRDDRRDRAYRTVQSIDLATRLQLPAGYDPADLAGRTFLVPA